MISVPYPPGSRRSAAFDGRTLDGPICPSPPFTVHDVTLQLRPAVLERAAPSCPRPPILLLLSLGEQRCVRGAFRRLCHSDSWRPVLCV